MENLQAVDPAFELNNFNEVKYYTPEETIVRNLLMLLFGKPGFYPSLPYLGMHIQDYLYRLEDDMDTSDIKAQLIVQCSDFLPLIENGEIDIIATHLNDYPLLVFTLPVLVQKQYEELALGVTILENGEMQFKFVFNDYNNQIL